MYLRFCPSASFKNLTKLCYWLNKGSKERPVPVPLFARQPNNAILLVKPRICNEGMKGGDVPAALFVRQLEELKKTVLMGVQRDPAREGMRSERRTQSGYKVDAENSLSLHKNLKEEN